MSMTLSLAKPSQSLAILQRCDATWQDDVTVRDRADLDWLKIAFDQDTSQVLTGLPITLLEQTLERLVTETNTAAAKWLMQQLQSARSET
jgi:hypothetical protein